MIYLQIGLGLLLFFFLLSLVLAVKNSTLKKEIKTLHARIEELALAAASDFPPAPSEPLADPLAMESREAAGENLSLSDEVMRLAEAGEQREAIAEKLQVPVSKIDLIIKFDKIKKEHSV